MVYLQDEGGVFDAPIDVVWKYIFGGGEHDKVHTSTRNSEFKNVSDCTILYTAERNYGGTWKRETMRISFFPPVAMVQELLEGPLAGSKWVYLYTAKGRKTGIDVYGEFKAKHLPAARVKKVALAFLASEFSEDAPAVRRMARGK
jgi:hypothetical protein